MLTAKGNLTQVFNCRRLSLQLKQMMLLCLHPVVCRTHSSSEYVGIAGHQSCSKLQRPQLQAKSSHESCSRNRVTILQTCMPDCQYDHRHASRWQTSTREWSRWLQDSTLSAQSVTQNVTRWDPLHTAPNYHKISVEHCFSLTWVLTSASWVHDGQNWPCRNLFRSTFHRIISHSHHLVNFQQPVTLNRQCSKLFRGSICSFGKVRQRLRMDRILCAKQLCRVFRPDNNLVKVEVGGSCRVVSPGYLCFPWKDRARASWQYTKLRAYCTLRFGQSPCYIHVFFVKIYSYSHMTMCCTPYT